MTTEDDELAKLMRATPIVESYIASRLDPRRFCFKPWQTEVLTTEQLHSQVSQSIERHGHWERYGELAMGGGPTVTLKPIDGEAGYLVTAECGIKVSGSYQSLDEALAAGSLFATLVWDMVRNGGANGLILPEEKS